MRETNDLEFKEQVSDSFLKTVTAFANYGGGRVLFGVDDAGNTVGLDDAVAAAQAIENKINDSIAPCPGFSLAVDEQAGTVALTVRPGQDTPYYYRSKTYKRSDSSTVEADPLELSRLILAGRNTSFEELPSKQQECSFATLETWLQRSLGIERLTPDMLKTLQLYSDAGGYSNVGALLADVNTFPGIDAVRFGHDVNRMLDRRTFDHMSVLTQHEKALDMFRTYYCYEEVRGALREERQLIPEEAFREAIANALVHRTWDVQAHIRVSMYADRIEISSPGGLTSGISEREYLEGQVSLLRNPVLGDVFFRLGIIERFGTGVARIKGAYEHSSAMPVFSVFENSLLVVLPLVDADANMTADERCVFEVLSTRGELSSTQVARLAGFGKTKTTRLLNELIAHGLVSKKGAARGTRYFV